MAEVNDPTNDSRNFFYLKWNNFSKIVSTQYELLRGAKSLTDITFVCDGKRMEAHKLVLFACSPFFKNLIEEDLNSKHLVFYFSDVKYEIMKALLEYMYMGEVHIQHEYLKDFIRTAEKLKVRGLDSGSGIEDMLREDSGKAGLEGRVPTQNFEKKRTTTIDTPSGKRMCGASDNDQILISPNQQPNTGQGSIDDPTTTTDKICTLLSSKNITGEEIHNIQVEYTGTIPNQNIQMGHSFKTEDPWIDDQLSMSQNAQQQQQQQEDSDTSITSPKSVKSIGKRLSNCMTPTSCHVCSRMYSNVSNLRQHMRLIHNPAPVICPICKKHFSSNLYLKRHYTSIHATPGHSGGEETVKTEQHHQTSQSDWQLYETKSS